MRGNVHFKSVRSDSDGCYYPVADVKGRIEIPRGDVVREAALLDLPETSYGLRGLQLQRMLEVLPGEYRGLDWYSSRDGSPRMLTLAARERGPWDDLQCGWRGDFAFRKFCIHPETLEFFGDYHSGMHADQVRRYGNRPFEEYCRLAYTGDGGRGVLLTRAYYTHRRPYDPEEDLQKTLRVLAVLTANGLPDDTELLLSAERDLWRANGFYS